MELVQWETMAVIINLLEWDCYQQRSIHVVLHNSDHGSGKRMACKGIELGVAAPRRPKYVPGWDCHGLPIELKVLQSMKDEQRAALTPIALRRKARDFAIKTMKAQREQFKR